MRDFFRKIVNSPHYTPITSITLVWLTSLCSVLNFNANKDELGFMWSVCAYLYAIDYYFKTKEY